MDKKNLTIGVLFLLAAFAIIKFGPRAPQPSPPAPSIGNIRPLAPGQPAPGPSAAPADATFAALETDNAGEHVTHLDNDFIDVALTDQGGAIKSIAFKKYPAELGKPDPYVFNALHVDPMLALVDFPGLDRGTHYTLVSQTAREAVFRAVFENRIEVTRRYVVEPSDTKTGDPYQLRHETVLRNLTGETAPLPRLAVSLGTATPVDVRDFGTYLDTGYSDGSSINFISRNKLQGGGPLSWFGMAPRGPVPYLETTSAIAWASVKNQFFTTILTPDAPGVGLITRRVELPPFPGTTVPAIGITGSVLLAPAPLAPHAQTTLGMNFYAGPKEYKRLANADVFKRDQDKVMEFGMFKFFSELLLNMMTWVHTWAPNWGLAVVLTTLTIKLIFLPFTFAAARSGRRMQQIQPLLKEIREKYKDNPKKFNEAQLALFREHKINPLGGCLPMLITFPFFLGFFRMLLCAPEFRFSSFLWVHDLSAPDTVAYIAGFPIRIMPLLMGATMIYQMSLVPQPTMGDQTQAKMMRFMPFIYIVFCYQYSCALSLYSTINGLFAIIQQLLINRMKNDGDPTHTAGAARPAGGKPLKNVSPVRKK
ncbi:MAG TPA: YidC/Oxa1 family insertase periplasmic-domain containing protein [Opitutaceae bacterium]|nr:YidC/Oxa1 family insertase periplasmic-domain containing protein [Opitutaceae bacterium]